MSKSESPKSHALGTRITDLKKRFQDASITQFDIKAFQRVAAVVENGQGHIHGDDLIAASFLVHPLFDGQQPR